MLEQSLISIQIFWTINPIIVINFFWWIISIYMESHLLINQKKNLAYFLMEKVNWQKKQVIDQKVESLFNFLWSFDKQILIDH